MTDTLETRAEDITELIRQVLGDDSASVWQDFAKCLPIWMTSEELFDLLMTNEVGRLQILQTVLERDGSGDDSEAAKVIECIRVMTMHGAKGLDAQVVFILGLEEGILPGRRAKKNPGLVDEAARLLYVSITRARAALILSRSKKRLDKGVMSYCTPSQFCNHTAGPFSNRTGKLNGSEVKESIQTVDTMNLIRSGK